MKVKIFTLRAKNRKPGFKNFEADINAWLAKHPNIVIENTTHVSSPSATFSMLALAVWYSEK
jgi:hypothetical protein